MKTDGMLLPVRGMRAGCAQRTAERRDIDRLDAIVLSPIEHSIDVVVRVGSAVDEAKADPQYLVETKLNTDHGQLFFVCQIQNSERREVQQSKTTSYWLAPGAQSISGYAHQTVPVVLASRLHTCSRTFITHMYSVGRRLIASMLIDLAGVHAYHNVSKHWTSL